MKMLLVAGIVLCTLLLAIMAGKRHKIRADKFLVAYLLFCLVQQLFLTGEQGGWLEHSPWLLLTKSLYLLNAPLFFFYVYALTSVRPLMRPVYAAVLTPFVAYVSMFFYYYLTGFGGQVISIRQGLLYLDGVLSLPWSFFVVLFLVIEPVFLVWFYSLLRAYRRRIAAVLSSDEAIRLHWLNFLFYLWLISSLLLVPLSTLSVSGSGLPFELMPVLLQATQVVSFFVLGYYGFKQTAVFSDLQLGQLSSGLPVRSGTTGYERSGLGPEQAAAHHARLLALMEEKKPYLDGALDAATLAQQLGVSLNHLSQVLNQQQKQNFFDFVNQYRVREVQQRMRDPRHRHLTLLALALDAGFNSKTTFNTLFKKFTGQTPSQYYKSLPE